MDDWRFDYLRGSRHQKHPSQLTLKMTIAQAVETSTKMRGQARIISRVRIVGMALHKILTDRTIIARVAVVGRVGEICTSTVLAGIAVVTLRLRVQPQLVTVGTRRTRPPIQARPRRAVVPPGTEVVPNRLIPVQLQWNAVQAGWAHLTLRSPRGVGETACGARFGDVAALGAMEADATLVRGRHL